MDLAVKAAAPLISPLVGPIIKDIKYPFNVADNVKALEIASDNLVAIRDDVIRQIEIAERQDQTRTNQVRHWMDQVKTVSEEATKISEKYNKRFLCIGGYSLKFWSNYSISKGASKKLIEVQDLCEKGKFQEVAVPKPSHVREVPIACSIQPTVDADFQRAINYIENDNVGIIGIWGRGGVGKTHLLRRINNSYKESTSFNVIMFVTASKGCSVRTIQSRITEKLSLAKKEDTELQASIILNVLNNRNFLLLLDDVRGRIDLEAVGIPHPLGISGQYKRKVVITTQSFDICRQMEVRKDIKVVCLNKEEAWYLFKEKVGEETLNSNPTVASLARNLADKLDGLPLALITIGRAMHAKREPIEWENALAQLQKSGLHEIETADTEECILQKLKFSYIV